MMLNYANQPIKVGTIISLKESFVIKANTKLVILTDISMLDVEYQGIVFFKERDKNRRKIVHF